MGPIKVLIADDQQLFAESLKFVLNQAGRGRIEVAGIAANGTEAISFVESHPVDVVLMDIRMPVMDGVEATAIIHQKYPKLVIMILTTFDDDELAVNALSHGATGYVLKDVDPTDLVRSIEAVHNGAFFISRSIGQKLMDIVKTDDGADAERNDEILAIMNNQPTLTRREAEVLFLAAKAVTNKEIAESLNISEKTVKNHLSAIFQKLSMRNRLQLIQYVGNLRNHLRLERNEHFGRVPPHR